ncbi:hypothetical protein GQ42DRAFT_126667, partial [Ramicandelaber brevisporus]
MCLYVYARFFFFFLTLWLFLIGTGVIGPDDTPYAGGHFDLDITIPETYPNEPPHVKFVTPIYHMNIDENGII